MWRWSETTVDTMLSFNYHISNICRKASEQLNIMKRRILQKIRTFNHVSLLCCVKFYFCPLILNFTRETSTKKIEKIQERTLRFIYNNYTCSYDNLLHISRLQTLRIWRLRYTELETYKILFYQGPGCQHDLVNYRNSYYYFRNQILVKIQ